MIHSCLCLTTNTLSSSSTRWLWILRSPVKFINTILSFTLLNFRTHIIHFKVLLNSSWHGTRYTVLSLNRPYLSCLYSPVNPQITEGSIPKFKHLNRLKEKRKKLSPFWKFYFDIGCPWFGRSKNLYTNKNIEETSSFF